jgi:nucleotide-binding universal stress UspA family protein
MTKARALDPEDTRRILVGVDGSPASLEALHWAVHQAELTGATLTVLTTWEWPGSYGWAPPVPEDFDPERDAGTVLEAAVASVRAGHPDVELDTLVVEGHPAPILVAESERADLLVVGSRGHGEFTGMLIGSVSEHCVANAHCPVLVVRGRD